jgi:hypothetical protein
MATSGRVRPEGEQSYANDLRGTREEIEVARCV